MWTLRVPDAGNSEVDLRKALTLVDGTKLYDLSVAELVAIQSVYEIYDSLGGQPSATLQHEALGPSCLSAIEVGYGQVQASGRLKDLRQRLLLNVEHCPYCGFGEVTDLDHYLPKTVYKAFAIYARNLIPSCSRCNNAKRAHVGDVPDEVLPHAYFSNLPDARFLVADVTFDASGLAVTFRIAATQIGAQLAQQLTFHLTKLKLNERYVKQINTFLFGLRAGIKDLLVRDDPGLTCKFLTEAALDLEGSFGKSDWRPALLLGLARCVEFCSGGAKVYFGSRSAPLAVPAELIS